MQIESYLSQPATFGAYEAAVAGVAQQLGALIREREPALAVEHVGSTAVPGCGGKGIIDLAVLYPEGLLPRARTVLDALGFQKQGGPEPFPEERPMRVGSVEHEGRAYRVHAHVLALGSEEHRQLVWFRDALRGDAALRQSYEARKRAILAAGMHDPLDYCKAKGIFITQALSRGAPARSGGPHLVPVVQDLPRPPAGLCAGEVFLHLDKILPGERKWGWLPFYHFRIRRADGTEVGHINFRVGDTEHVRVTAGHIGYQVLEPFRGHRYALQACQAIAPLVACLYEAVIITCDPDNAASRRTIERLGAGFLEEVPVPRHDPHYQRGSRRKRRYEWRP